MKVSLHKIFKFESNGVYEISLLNHFNYKVYYAFCIFISSYSPTLQSGQSFTFSNAQIPSHIQFGWGQTHYDKFGVTDYVDFGESGFQYHTGNLSISTATFPNKDNQSVHLSRNSSKYYRNHEPDGGSGAVVNSSSSRWRNTLVIDKANMNGDDWAFAPYANQAERGFAFGGNTYSSVLDDGAYILWVR